MKQIYDILTALTQHLGNDVLIGVRASYDCLIFDFRWKQDGEKKSYRHAVSIAEMNTVDAALFVEYLKYKLGSFEIKPEALHTP